VALSDEDLVHLFCQACAEPSRRTSRSVSPDGYLVGSPGEIYAAQVLNLRLEAASNAGSDATDEEGLRVEIKATTRSSIAQSASGILAQQLVVVNPGGNTGSAQIAYDGYAQLAWDLAGKPGTNRQRRLSIRKLLGQNKT